MVTIAPMAGGEQVTGPTGEASRPRASANGGVLVLAQAWAALVGGEGLLSGVRWQGQGGMLLLFALVALPLVVVGPTSVLAIVKLATGIGILWRALDWGQVLAQRRLARFVSSPRHNWLGVYGAVLRRLGNLGVIAPSAPDESGLVVDSLVVEKRYGPKLPGIRPVYDPVQQKLVDGYEIVSCCLVNAENSCPVGLLPHEKAETAEGRAKAKRRRRKALPGELPSKLDLALALIGIALASGIVGPTLIGDGGFAVMWFLREVAQLGLHWLVSTRHDRRLRIGTEIARFRDWAKCASLSCIVPGKDEGGVWGAILPQATLLEKGCAVKGLACRPAYLERRNAQGRVIHQWYLVSSHLDWDLASIWLYWSWRWQIEVWHRIWKQQLRLTQFHVRSWSGITSLLACSSLRATLVTYLQTLAPAWQGLSVQGLIFQLTQLACQVTVGSDSPVQVGRPELLPEAVGWQDQPPPLPAQYWRIQLKTT